jgi:predicted phage tail protein
VASGTPTSCSKSGFWPGLSYRWWTRTVDSAGIAGPWVAYATNAEEAADFRVNRVAAQPTGRGQRQADGATPIGLGGRATSSTVVFLGTVTDPDPGQEVRLQVEVRPLGTAFTGAVHCRSALVASGTPTRCSVGGLTPGISYHWQTRSVDSVGVASPWTSYATNAEAAADFVVTPTPPIQPTARGQRQADGLTPIGLGGWATSPTVVFLGTVSHVDPSQPVRLQIEVRPVGTPFTGMAHCQSGWVTNGTAASCSVSGLAQGTSYHWQTRTVDSAGMASPWASYATNTEEAADFRVNTVPARPTGRGQRETDGTTPIGLGGWASSTTVVFLGTPSDQDVGQQVRLQIEVQPLGTAFAGTAHCQSALVASGTATSCSVGGLAPGTGYHWQTRTVDSRGGVSPWASYAMNGEDAADFAVNTVPARPTGRGQRETNGATPISLGRWTSSTTVVFLGTPSDPDPGQRVRLQIEVQPVGTAFTGTARCQSGLVSSGTATTCSVPGLIPGTSYHWQTRTVDSLGAVSPWASYATNAEDAADFVVNPLAAGVVGNAP